jgi:hypothetical protein
MTTIDRRDPSIIQGAHFSWLYRYNSQVTERFVQRLVTSDERSEALIAFNVFEGSKANLSNFSLLYDINILNAEICWQLRNHGAESQAIVFRQINKDLLYKRTQDIHAPELEDMLQAISMALKSHPLPLAFPTEISERTARNTVILSTLYPRDISRTKIDNSGAAYSLKFVYPSHFASRGQGYSLKPDEDKDVN